MIRTTVPMIAGTSLLASMLSAAVAGPMPIEDPIPEPIEVGDTMIRLKPIVEGITAPNWGTHIPGGDPDRFFVTDQDGQVIEIDLETGETQVFLDVSADLVELGAFGPGSFDERGLLGLAFHPDYLKNGLLYTYESRPAIKGAADFSTMPEGEDPNHQATINEYEVADPGDPEAVVDPGTRREILRIDEPQFNHDGGAIAFGDDGFLYISLGDGGSADDQGVGHVAGGNGQDSSNILGNILRIDPQGSNGVNGEYGVPGDNPFVGDPEALDEIFAYGLRNPFRFSFDQMTGDLIVADVGQNDIEEINLVTGGENFGWRVKEGTFLFEPLEEGEPGFVYEDSPGMPAGMTDPVAQYDHDEGISVIGGFVYRGSLVPELDGQYIFGDFSQQFAIPRGRLFMTDLSGDGAGVITEADVEGIDESAGDGIERFILGFGQDASGEVYVMVNSTGVPFESTGAVLRVSPLCPPDLNLDFIVDSADLNEVLGAFGCTGGDCDGDVDGDGDTDSEDLNAVLGAFGDECD